MHALSNTEEETSSYICVSSNSGSGDSLSHGEPGVGNVVSQPKIINYCVEKLLLL